MTYSLESLVFRAVGCAVNTAAWAANNLLEQMYPKDVPAAGSCGIAAHGADPHPASAANPAGDVPPTPAGSLTSPAAGGEGDRDPFPVVDAALAGNRDTKATAAGGLTWEGWALPAILEVLGDHQPHLEIGRWCCFTPGEQAHAHFFDMYDWREHVAPLIAARIGCDRPKAIVALLNYTPTQ